MTILTLGVAWFALGQNTDTPSEPAAPVMQTPLIRDLAMVKDVENLTKRVDTLESTVSKLEDEINNLKQKSGK
jgi:uncharacterized protein YlxW (UPF0749 family)